MADYVVSQAIPSNEQLRPTSGTHTELLIKQLLYHSFAVSV